MSIDASLLKEVVERKTLHDVVHEDLNRDTPWLEGRVATTEVLAYVIFERLALAVGEVSDTARLDSVTRQETRRISVAVTR